MDKILRLTKQIEELEIQHEEAQDFIKQVEERCRQNYQSIAEAYRDFFDSKTDREFNLYKRFPSVEALDLYLRRNGEFPLYSNGSLNAKELAEIIKHIYQFKTGKEYSILTIGVTEHSTESVWSVLSYSIMPHLFFMVGNEKTLASYRDFNGKFINEARLYPFIYFNANGKNLINIELDRANLCDDSLLDIECLTGSLVDQAGQINYYDLLEESYKETNFSAFKNVFSSDIRRNLSSYSNKVRGIKDVFDFDISHLDTFIARVLISIIIYKRNNHIEELTEDDYNHIFDVLFGEKVNIKSSVEEDFPKSLVYVPNSRFRK